MHNSAITSLKTYDSTLFKDRAIGVSKRLKIVAHMYRDEKFTCRELISRANKHGGEPISFKAGQPRVSELIKSNYMHKTREYKKENGRDVEILKYGHSMFGKVKTFHECFVEETKNRMTDEEFFLVNENAKRMFKYNRKRA